MGSRAGRRLNVQRMGREKGNTGDGRGQPGVLDEGSGEVWPRPEEVSYAAPSCEKITQG